MIRRAFAPLRRVAKGVARSVGALGLLWALGPSSLDGQAVPTVREAGFELRRDWLEGMRSYPGETYIQNPILAVRATGASLRDGSVLLTPWRAIGPFGFQTSGFYGSSPNADGGRIRAVAIHPTNPRIVYVGAASGGVWRTMNGGASWTPLTDFQCTLNVGAIALDPVDPAIVYVGTGEPAVSNGCGLLRSFNSGNSWQEINGSGVLAPTNATQSTRAYRVRVDRATAGSQSTTLVLYAASNGLHRSVNSGTTWATVLSGLVTDVEQDPTDDNVFWAARALNGGANGIWRSSDRGQTWAQVYVAPTSAQRIALAVSPAAPGRVWAGVVVAARLATLVRYRHDDASLTTLAAGGLYGVTTRLDFGTQSTYNLVLEVDPADSSTVYAGGSRIYRSRNGGQSFSVVAYDLHVDWHAFEFAPSDPNLIYGGCDGGVYVSYDASNSWASLNSNIAVTQFYPGIAVHPTQPDVVAGGLQDNSSLWGFGSSFWTMSAPTGDGGFNAWSPTDPNVFWATSYTFGYIVRATRAALGAGLSLAYRGFSGTDRKAFLPPLAIDPTTGSTLYYGTYRLWRTTNEGSSWGVASLDLTKGSGVITSIAISPADPRVIWTGASDGNVQVSVDAGVTFNLRTTGLPNRALTDIAIDATDFNRAVVTFSGTGAPHVYLTVDAGVSWTNVSAALPDIPFNAVVLIPGTPRIIVAADVGIYESENSGVSWALVSTGFPNVRVLDLVLQPPTGLLYASTYGRGIWKASVLTGSAVLRGDLDGDGLVNAFDAVLAQQSLVGIRPAATATPMPAGDANCNGALDAGDVLAILQFAVGSAPASLCVGTVR